MMPQPNTAEFIQDPELKTKIIVQSEQENVLYELPFNEKIRTFIRLESLFHEIDYKLLGTTEWDTRSTVNSFIALTNVFNRPEIKSDLIKELSRISQALSKYAKVDGVNTNHLEDLQDELKHTVKALKTMEGQIGQSLKINELIIAIKQRNSLPGGALGIDIPNYAHWLAQDISARNNDIRSWLREFDLVRSAVALVLHLIRDSVVENKVIATKGFYQHSTDAGTVTQIVRVFLPKNTGYYPEISGGRQRFSIRFLKPMGAARSIQVDHDVQFQIVCCAI